MPEEERAGSYFLHNVPLPDALERWHADQAAAACPRHVDIETIGVEEAAGRVVADPVWARRSSPAYDGAAMDGIAVRAEDTAGASESMPVLLDRAAFAHVDTGDPIREPFDAVVMREHTHLDADGRAELRASVAPYQHVRSLGEDVAETELLLAPGQRLRPILHRRACGTAAFRPPRYLAASQWGQDRYAAIGYRPETAATIVRIKNAAAMRHAAAAYRVWVVGTASALLGQRR